MPFVSYPTLHIAPSDRVHNSTCHRDVLLEQFQHRIEPNPDLDRRLVSYQADKSSPFFRWFKYKEGFTSQLVHYLLQRIHPEPGVLLDPFAGSGTALFVASALGWKPYGIELLPVGIQVVRARKAAHQIDPALLADTIRRLVSLDFASFYQEDHTFKHIAITRGAFSTETEQQLIGYISYCKTHISDQNLQELLLFASFCILEEISYTRKDGQYLRWDARSGRSQGAKPFDKGVIPPFSQALQAKLYQIYDDLTICTSNGQLSLGFNDCQLPHHQHACFPQITQGSCLEELPRIASGSINVIVTSPPYCNRYDYTRTYALELVYLGYSHEEVSRLRQNMLSCTVENKTKREDISNIYAKQGREEDFYLGERVFQSIRALHEVLDILDHLRDTRKLNNPNIARMVRNYFYEMCFVVLEMSRILVPGGHVIMINDNVQYAGEEVPVDLILSRMAEAYGFTVDKIWMLARGKGNSSQQMGKHGRSELRKCVYVWQRSTTG